MEGLYANTRCVNNEQWEKFELGLGSDFQGYKGQVNSNYVHLDLEWTGSGTWELDFSLTKINENIHPWPGTINGDGKKVDIKAIQTQHRFRIFKTKCVNKYWRWVSRSVFDNSDILQSIRQLQGVTGQIKLSEEEDLSTDLSLVTILSVGKI